MHISAQRKYTVSLLQSEQEQLTTIVRKGTSKARIITRARILMLSNKGAKDKDICQALGIERSSINDIRRKYTQGGLKKALYDAPRPGKQRSVKAADEAMITAIACSTPQEGFSSWTLDLITEEFNRTREKGVSRNTIWRVLLRNNLQPHRKKNVVYSQGNI